MQSVLQEEYDHSAGQIPLIHIVDYDDVVLINSAQAEWFLILKDLPWERYRTHAANYYDALYEFNRVRNFTFWSGVSQRYLGTTVE